MTPVISTIQPVVALNILSPCEFYGGFRACILLKCNFRGRDITLLLLQQLLVNLTHGYVIPCAGHCTNQTKDGSSLNQPSPRQPKQKEVNITGFLKWKYDFLWYGSVINKRNANRSPATLKDTSHP